MGEVYRARDSKLGREVAIKVLPEELALDAERLTRFGREARVLASLNHPNVATLHGFEQAGDTHFLVMELVEGETLADRIARGAIPVQDAIPLFVQIAEGLEAAHQQGIVHRDLKPANVKMIGRPSGGIGAGMDGTRVKLLDFGLAKAIEKEMAVGAAAPGESLTLTAEPTRAGVLLGTPAYMSPQQVQGLAPDKRSDIWAYGVCLYESLTGSRPFAGANSSMTLAAVLKEEPDLERVDPRLRRLVARCLEKNPARRYHDIADVRLDLEAAGGNDVVAAARPWPGGREKVAWAAAVVAVVVAAVIAAIAMATRSPAPPERSLAPTTRLSISAPDLMPEEAFSVAISPDGRTVVYIGQVNGRRRLMRRDLDALEATPIPGTEDSWGFQYFSPDGKWLAHMSGASVLQKVPLEGGRPVDLAHALLWSGGDWASNGALVVGNTEDLRIYRLSDTGGDLVPLTTLEDGEAGHSRPRFLPGEQSIVFAVLRSDGTHVLAVQRLGETEHAVLMEGDQPFFLTSGHLVFWRGSGLWAVRFDAKALQVVGEAVPLVDEPYAPRGWAAVSVSRSGALVYTPRTAGIRGPLVWLDRAGREIPIGLPPGDYLHPRVAPDGRSIAFVSVDGAEGLGRRGRGDVLILDQSSLQPRVILSDPRSSESPLWAPDGRTLVFRGLTQQGGETVRLYDQSRVRDIGLPNPDTSTPSGWTREGLLLASFARAKTRGDLFTVNLETGARTVLLATADDEKLPVLSPNGSWLAYQDAETEGEAKIMIRPFPLVDSGGPWLVAAGTSPSWNPNGRELFFVRDEALWSVRMGPEPPFVQGDPVPLVKGPYFETPFYSRPYDYDPHTDRFLVVRTELPRRSLVVVQNLAAELERRFAGRQP